MFWHNGGNLQQKKTYFDFCIKDPLKRACFYNWAHEAYVSGELINIPAWNYEGKNTYQGKM